MLPFPESPMILADLHLQAFRAHAGTHLEGLLRVNLVVGANNVGKSSILEAAALILRPFDPGQWVQAARTRDVTTALMPGLWSMFPGAGVLHLEDGPQETEPIRLRAVLAGAPRELSARAQARQVVEVDPFDDVPDAADDEDTMIEDFRAGDSRFRGARRLGSNKAVPSLSVVLEVDENGHTVAHRMDFVEHTRVEPGRDVRPYRVFTVTPATHRSTSLLVEHLSRAVDEGQKQLALSLLRVFDPAVTDIDISRAFGRDAIRLTHATRGVVDLSSFGDGMRRSTAIALALARASGGLVLIDELEAGIHARALRDVMSKLITAARASDVQILATTHSLEAIDAVIDAASGDATVDVAGYHVRRDGDKHDVRRYDGARLVALREAGLDLR